MHARVFKKDQNDTPFEASCTKNDGERERERRRKKRQSYTSIKNKSSLKSKLDSASLSIQSSSFFPTHQAIKWCGREESNRKQASTYAFKWKQTNRCKNTIGERNEKRVARTQSCDYRSPFAPTEVEQGQGVSKWFSPPRSSGRHKCIDSFF